MSMWEFKKSSSYDLNHEKNKSFKSSAIEISESSLNEGIKGDKGKFSTIILLYIIDYWLILKEYTNNWIRFFWKQPLIKRTNTKQAARIRSEHYSQIQNKYKLQKRARAPLFPWTMNTFTPMFCPQIHHGFDSIYHLSIISGSPNCPYHRSRSMYNCLFPLDIFHGKP